MVTPKGRPVAINVMDHRFKRETGDVDATFNLASMLRDGQGGPKKRLRPEANDRLRDRASVYKKTEFLHKLAWVRATVRWETPATQAKCSHTRCPRVEWWHPKSRAAYESHSGAKRHGVLKICAPSSMQMYAGLERDQLLRNRW